MKKIILLSPIALFFGLSAFAKIGDKISTDTTKPLQFGVNGKYERPVKKESLIDCDSLNDIIAYYPVNWITTYDSVEILATCNGKTMRAMSANDKLSTEQKNILKTIDLGADLYINV